MRLDWSAIGRIGVSICLVTDVVRASELISSEKLQNDITTKGLQNNLWHLNKIARDNGGNRAFGLPGYEKSRDFVLQRVKRFSTVDSWVQPFTEWFAQTFEITLSIDGGIGAVPIVTFTGAMATPNRKPITAPLVVVPVNDVTGTGCLESDYDNIDAVGKIVVIKRGLCTFAIKSVIAKRRGAVGALIRNNVLTVVNGRLGGKDDYAPVGLIGLADGEMIVARLAAGEVLNATLLVDSIAEDRETWNVIAETKGGDPDNVIVLGAHLDSVQAGPGINDDGSGSTALLELIGAVKHYSVRNKVRFIWWGAEESGLLGSYHYTETLSPEEASKVSLYLNFDMIGSPDAFYGVFDGDGSAYGFAPAPGSAQIETLFSDYLTSKGKVITPVDFGNNTDYVGFINIGVPVGGLFTGTQPQDNCYHLACDDINNVNWDAITLNARAAAHVLATYALSTEGIPKRAERLRSRAVREQREIVHRHHGSCNDHEEEL